ncbi:MAG: response regulator [Clostridia bacterium]|nr:response regulator [Clostridia bacterium]
MRVLVIDDEPKIRQNLMRMVACSPGFSAVGSAQNGAEALDMLSDCAPDIMITDIRMPRMDGLQFIRELRRAGSDAVCIVLSGYDDFSYAKSAMQLGVRNYLLKPVGQEELEAALRQAAQEVEQQRSVMFRLRQEEQARRERRLLQILHGQFASADAAFSQENMRLYVADIFAEIMPHNEALLRSLTDGEHIVVSVSEERVAMLALSAEPPVACARRLHACLQTEEARVRVVYSEALHAPEGIYQSYRAMRRLLDSGWLIKGTDVLCISEISFEPNPQALEQLHRWHHAPLDSAINSGNMEEIARQVERFFQLLSDAQAPDEAVRSYFIEELIHTMKLVTDPGGDAEAILEGTLSISELMHSHTISSLEAWYLDFCRNIARYLDGMRRKRPSKVADQVQALFLKDPSRSYSLAELSETFYMSPVYLGQVFKKETGQTLHAYLTQERIRLSKEKLASTSDPVYEIAESVGYQNLRSFYTAFKKSEGCTPNEFREQYQNH